MDEQKRLCLKQLQKIFANFPQKTFDSNVIFSKEQKHSLKFALVKEV